MSQMSKAATGGAAATAYADDVAAAAGTLQGEVIERIPPLLRLTPQVRRQKAIDGLAELHAHDMLTDTEVGKLTTIVSTLSARDGTATARAAHVSSIHQELLAAHAGSLALTIASVTSKAADAEARMGGDPSATFDIGDFSTPGECACAGAIVGATAGIVLGPAGVVGGALAGAAGGYVGGLIAQAVLS
jgi:hypothetical protein